MALRRSVSFPRGTMVTYVTWDVPLWELELHRTLGERDIHTTRLANHCLVWKITAMAREKKSQEWLANLCQEPDECEGHRPPCSVAVEERPWRPLYLELSELWLPKAGSLRTLSLNFRAYSFLIEGALDWRIVSATSVERPKAMSCAPSGVTPTASTTPSRGERSCLLTVRGDPSWRESPMESHRGGKSGQRTIPEPGQNGF